MFIFEELSRWLVPALIVLGTLLAGIVIRNILFFHLRRRFPLVRSRTIETVITAIRGPFLFWWLLLGVSLAMRGAFLPFRVEDVVNKTLLVLAMASVTLAASNVATGLIRLNAARLETTLPITSLTDNITRVAIYLLGALFILNALGISVVPVLATLGVAGLAVGLALQETVANFFSGFHIIFSKQLKIGDYIKLESGVEGFISDINWRTTRIVLVTGSVALVPNSKLTSAIITDYCVPACELSFSIEVTVGFASDLEKVERVTLEAAREVQKTVAGAVAGFEPAARFVSFGEYGVKLSVSLRSKEFSGQFLMRHEFIKRLNARYQREGIVIPCPPIK